MKKKTSTTKDYQPRSPNNSFQSADPQGADGLRHDVIELILRDHLPLKDLIKVLKDPSLERTEKENAFEEFAYFLKGHAMAEESTLYVAMKNYADLKIESLEGDTEHSFADQLLHEINAASDDHEWLAKTKVLAEMLEHHIEEEENEMLKHVERSIPEVVRFKIGQEYTRLHEEFMELNEIKAPRRVQFPRVELPKIVSLS